MNGPAGELDRNQERAARGLDRANREAREIIIRIDVLLPPLQTDLLVEIPACIVQADGDERDSKVARGL